jgi:hypothetical protein
MPNKYIKLSTYFNFLRFILMSYASYLKKNSGKGYTRIELGEIYHQLGNVSLPVVTKTAPAKARKAPAKAKKPPAKRSQPLVVPSPPSRDVVTMVVIEVYKNGGDIGAFEVYNYASAERAREEFTRLTGQTLQKGESIAEGKSLFDESKTKDYNVLYRASRVY